MRRDHSIETLIHPNAQPQVLFLESRSADQHLDIRISRNTLVALLVSLLLHALVFFALPEIKLDAPASASARAIQVSIVPVLPTQIVTPDQIMQAPSAAPKPVRPPAKKVPKAPILPKPYESVKPNKKSAIVVPVTPDNPTNLETDRQPLKERRSADPPIEQQYTDMASYVKAMQARRLDSEAAAAQVNAEAAARERGPTEAQLRDERIKKNLKYGTNGIFEITSMSPRHATFAFRGWTNDYLGSKRQFFEVEAASGQDIRLLMIKRMIVLIREHYDGDFNWESHRLGRTVVQSARPEDNAGLEHFLMMEFFGSNYKIMQYP